MTNSLKIPKVFSIPSLPFFSIESLKIAVRMISLHNIKRKIHCVPLFRKFLRVDYFRLVRWRFYNSVLIHFSIILLFVAEDISEISASRLCSANSSLLLLRILLSYNESQKSQNPLLSGGNFSPVPSVHIGRSFLVANFRYPFLSICYHGVSVAFYSP